MRWCVNCFYRGVTLAQLKILRKAALLSAVFTFYCIMPGACPGFLAFSQQVPNKVALYIGEVVTARFYAG